MLAAHVKLADIILPMVLPAATTGLQVALTKHSNVRYFPVAAHPFEASCSTLQDSEDDVRAVAADALIPVADAIAQGNRSTLTSLLTTLWNLLLSPEDLSLSTGTFPAMLICRLLSNCRDMASEETLSIDSCRQCFAAACIALPPYLEFRCHRQPAQASSALVALLSTCTQQSSSCSSSLLILYPKFGAERYRAVEPLYFGERLSPLLSKPC